MPKLRSLSPLFAEQLSSALREDGHDELAQSVPELTVTKRCCTDSFCASFHTADVTAQAIADRGTRLIPCVPGLACVFVVDGAIVMVELLNRKDVHDALASAFP